MIWLKKKQNNIGLKLFGYRNPTLNPESWRKKVFFSLQTSFLHSGPPLWYQQGNERMSHKLSLFELLAADSK